MPALPGSSFIVRQLSGEWQPFMASCHLKITRRASLFNKYRPWHKGIKVAKLYARCLIRIVSRGNLRPPEVPEALLPGGTVQRRSARFHFSASASTMSERRDLVAGCRKSPRSCVDKLSTSVCAAEFRTHRVTSRESTGD